MSGSNESPGVCRYPELTSNIINLAVSLATVGQLVVFESCPSVGVMHEEIRSREVFLFDVNGVAVWQISPEPGTTGNRAHAFDRSIPTTEPFTTVWEAYGDYHASRINGDSFRFDLATGHAVYSGWART